MCVCELCVGVHVFELACVCVSVCEFVCVCLLVVCCFVNA